jgi:RHS repeat-associated protein
MNAAGNKLEKCTVEVAPMNKSTVTTYIGGSVYENDVLQFTGHEEGRVRVVRGSGSPVYVYDYFIKDHLGNTRMVLTDEQKTDAYPVASLEAGTIATEKLYYNIPDGATVNKNTVAGYPTDSYTNPNDYIQKLNGNGTKVGTSITLKVMSGDSYNIRANSWYRNNGASPGTPVSPLSSILSALAGGISAASGGKATAATLLSNNTLDPAVGNFLSNQTPISTRPKAFLNWILFDEQFKYVSGGFDQVGNDQEFKTHTQTGLPITRNGYLYVYVSNETPNIDVFFDNVQVTHIRGPLTEETHYYPFGLTMAGISSKAAGKMENRYKYNEGTERTTDLDLNWDETDFRSYDSQIGRFLQIDPLADFFEYFSPYVYAENNPILMNDPYGLEPSKLTDPNTLPEVVVTSVRHKKPPLTKAAPTSLPSGAKPLVLNSNVNIASPQPAQPTPSLPSVKVTPKASVSKPAMLTSADIATNLMNSGRINFDQIHSAPSNPRFANDLANADDNIRDAAAGRQAHTSVYGDAQGRLVTLDIRLLRMLDRLSQQYTFEVSEITGGDHSTNSRHYAGIAIDIVRINGVPVNSKNPHYRAFMQKARALGATEVLGPGNKYHGTHIHLGLPR